MEQRRREQAPALRCHKKVQPFDKHLFDGCATGAHMGAPYGSFDKGGIGCRRQTDKQKFAELFAVLKASLVKGRWVALKRRLGGIPHAATPLFCKVFGEFVLPARIPPDRLKGDPTPFNKGVFGAGKLFGRFLFDGKYIPNPCRRHTFVISH